MAEWVALRVLFEQVETSHADLIQRLGTTKGAASKIVSRLEEGGLAKRRTVGNAQRGQVLSLTRKGKALVPRLATLADQNDAHFFGHLSVTQRKALRDILKTLVALHQLREVPVT